jgi:Flp pilus assembly pilin Flp
MRRLMARFLLEEHAQDLIEYALLCALLGVAGITGLLELSRILEFFAALGMALDNAL